MMQRPISSTVQLIKQKRQSLKSASINLNRQNTQFEYKNDSEQKLLNPRIEYTNASHYSKEY